MAFVALEDRHVAATDVIGHEVADLGFVGTDPEFKANVRLVAELQGITTAGAALDIVEVVGGLVVELSVHSDQRVVTE